MTMSYVWCGMIFFSVVFGLLNGTTQEVSAATLEGATTAVNLAISMTGGICLWCGFMELLKQCGLAQALAKCMKPFLGRLFPDVAKDDTVLGAISANVSANLLGLGNAATPFGIQAVRGLGTKAKGQATSSMCLLIVCNTASIQLIPTTVATLRAATGSESPFDILPCVWIASSLSVCMGILLCKILEKVWKKVE